MLKKTAGKTAKEAFMKKGKIVIVGLIALLMACGLVLAGCRLNTCGQNCYDNGNGNSSICGMDNCPVKNKGTCNCSTFY